MVPPGARAGRQIGFPLGPLIPHWRHVTNFVDKHCSVNYIGNTGQVKEAGSLSRKEKLDPASSTERPEGRPLTKAALLDSPGQEDGAYDATEAEGSRARSHREAHLHHRQAGAQPLVGGARPGR